MVILDSHLITKLYWVNYVDVDDQVMCGLVDLITDVCPMLF